MQRQELSLVSACMNREAHLRASLPRWLSLAFLKEVLIVDWSNASPLWDLLALDQRVRIVRVVDEARWVLSYAYNLGIASAACETVIKCDADCALHASIEDFQPHASGFFAGYWLSGRKTGKNSINGQCVIQRRQFERVNGYSELIRSYGREDEDFYDRLIAAGFRRGEIPPSVFELIQHSDAERLRHQPPGEPAGDMGRLLAARPDFLEAYNYIVGKMAPWSGVYQRAGYDTLEQTARTVTLRRRLADEVRLPPEVAADARLFAMRVVARNVLKLPGDACDRLSEAACRELLAPVLLAGGRPA